MTSTTNKPRWLAELSLSLASNPQVVLTGNVRDYHVIERTDQVTLTKIDTLEAIRHEFAARGIDTVFVYNPVEGLSVICPRGSRAEAVKTLLNGVKEDRRGALIDLVEKESKSAFPPALKYVDPSGVQWLKPADCKNLLPDLMECVARSMEVACAMVLDFASWLAPGSERGQTGSDPSTEAAPALRRASILATQAQPVLVGRDCPLYNPIVWVVRQPGELPTWLTGSPGVRIISIEQPGQESRRSYCALLLRYWAQYRDLGAREGQAALDKVLEQFVDVTEGFTLRQCRDILNLAEDSGLGPKDLKTAQFAYRVGVIDSEWEKPRLKATIRGELCEQGLRGANLQGQDQAVSKAADIIQRAAMGLAGAETSANPNRPKGVLFLAGPTGVGKTLLAKSIATLVFGRLDNYLRFDMSEYSQAHAEARLIGAPPGYVGYSAGGQLTEGVRQRPFSLLLFDEIEKAHHSILDKFLQLLDEGRLTDGSGTTVNFSETIVVFTSNLGVSEIQRNEFGQDVPVDLVKYSERFPADGTPGIAFETLELRVRKGVRDFFTSKIQRPELFNRIGEGNIVVFDFIDRETARKIVAGAVQNVRDAVRRKHGVQLELSEAATAQLHAMVLTEQRLTMGGRGLNSAVEECLVNPLSRALAQLIDEDGVFNLKRATVTSVTLDPQLNRRVVTLQTA